VRAPSQRSFLIPLDPRTKTDHTGPGPTAPGILGRGGARCHPHAYAARTSAAPSTIWHCALVPPRCALGTRINDIRFASSHVEIPRAPPAFFSLARRGGRISVRRSISPACMHAHMLQGYLAHAQMPQGYLAHKQPHIRALLGTASHFCEVVVLKSCWDGAGARAAVRSPVGQREAGALPLHSSLLLYYSRA